MTTSKLDIRYYRTLALREYIISHKIDKDRLLFIPKKSNYIVEYDMCDAFKKGDVVEICSDVDASSILLYDHIRLNGLTSGCYIGLLEWQRKLLGI